MLLKGRTLLVVEDETMVFFFIEDALRDLGCGDVWRACDVPEALELLTTKKPDAAILDVNLHGVKAFPVAERLADLQIPFVFATGYGRHGIPDEWSAREVLQKPFEQGTLAAVMETLLK